MEKDSRMASQPQRRDDRPKVNPKEDLDYRINGLEKLKQDPDMTQADIAALERVIVKLRTKKAEQAS